MTARPARSGTLKVLGGAGALSILLIVALAVKLGLETANVSTDGPLGSDVTVEPVIEVDIAGLDEDEELVGTAMLREGVIAVTGGGSVLVSEQLDSWSAVSLADSIGASVDVELNGLASNGDTVLAAGAEEGLPAIWRSRNGTEWERLDGDNAPADELSEIVWHGDEFLGISGNRDLWRSRTGEEWSRQTTTGLERSDDYQVQSLQGLAATGRELIALEYRELADTNDDGDLVLYRSTDGGGSWQQTDTDGLESLYEQNPNMPVLPAVAGAVDGFVVAAEGPDSQATIWGSLDGVTWGEGVGLGAPPLVFRDIDGVALNATNLLALSLDDGQLIVWRVTR